MSSRLGVVNQFYPIFSTFSLNRIEYSNQVSRILVSWIPSNEKNKSVFVEHYQTKVILCRIVLIREFPFSDFGI